MSSFDIPLEDIQAAQNLGGPREPAKELDEDFVIDQAINAELDRLIEEERKRLTAPPEAPGQDYQFDPMAQQVEPGVGDMLGVVQPGDEHRVMGTTPEMPAGLEAVQALGAGFDRAITQAGNDFFKLAHRFNRGVENLVNMIPGAQTRTSPDSEPIPEGPFQRTIPDVKEPRLFSEIADVVGESLGFMSTLIGPSGAANAMVKGTGIGSAMLRGSTLPATAYAQKYGETGNVQESAKQAAATTLFMGLGAVADRGAKFLAGKGLPPTASKMLTEWVSGLGITSVVHREQVMAGVEGFVELGRIKEQLEQSEDADEILRLTEEAEKHKAAFDRALVIIAGDTIAGTVLGSMRSMPEVREAYERHQLRKALPKNVEDAMVGTGHVVTKGDKLRKPGFKDVKTGDLDEVAAIARAKKAVTANNNALYFAAYGAEPTTQQGIWRTSKENGATQDGRITVGEDGVSVFFQPKGDDAAWRKVEIESIYPKGAEPGDGVGAELWGRVEQFDMVVSPKLQAEDAEMWRSVMDWARDGRGDLDPMLRDELAAVFADDGMLQLAQQDPQMVAESVARMMHQGTAEWVQQRVSQPKPKVKPVEKAEEPEKLDPEAGVVRLEKGEPKLGSVLEGIKATAGKELVGAANWFESMGPAGKEGAEGLRRVSRRSAAEEAKDIQSLDKIFDGQKDADLELAMKLANERVAADDVPENIRKLTEDVRVVMDRALNESKKLGMKRQQPSGDWVPIEGSGKYYPQVLNKLGRQVMDLIRKDRKDLKVQKAAESMVAAGKAESVKKAVELMAKWSENQRLRKTNSYLESSRIELPEELVEWNPRKTLENSLRGTWKTVEAVREWEFGVHGKEAKLTKAAGIGERIGKETGSDWYAERWRQYIRSQFGDQTKSPVGKLGTTVSSYMTLSKLGFSFASALRNGMQGFVNGAHYPWLTYAKTLKDLPPQALFWIDAVKETRKKMERAGAVGGVTSISDIEPGMKNAFTRVAMKPFTSAEIANQTRSAIVAWKGMEADLAKLIKKAGDAPDVIKVTGPILERVVGADVQSLRRRINKLGVSDEQIREAMKRGRWTQAELETAAYRMVSDTQFRMDAATKRFWYDISPLRRPLYKFKQFAIDQYLYATKYVLSEMKHGNMAPAVRFFVANVIAGEIYHLATDLITGNERSWAKQAFTGNAKDGRQWAEDVIAKFAAGGGIGFLMDMTWGIGNWAVGPLQGTYENLKQFGGAVIQDPRMAVDAAGTLLKNETRALKDFSHAWDRIVGGEPVQRGRKIQQWRSRAYTWKDHEDNPGVGGMIREGLNSVVQGRATRMMQSGTYALRGAAQELKSGDIPGAADFMASILDRVKPADYKRKVNGIVQSMKKQGPQGPVAQRDLAKFLKGYSAAEKKEFFQLQANWRKDFYAALRIAIKRTRPSKTR